MKNPWLQLSKDSPFILPCDAKLINIFNNRWCDTPFEIILDEIPSPYIGNPESPVFFLNLNPAYSLEESNSPLINQYRKIARNNLLHEFKDYPFYVLNPLLVGTPSGYCWFKEKFNPLIKAINISKQEISKKIFLAEYFPYRSKKYKWGNDILPSQKYTISLIEKAIVRNAIIVIMRGRKLWFSLMPALKKYPNCYILHSPQNVTISEKNLGVDGFKIVVESLRK